MRKMIISKYMVMQTNAWYVGQLCFTTFPEPYDRATGYYGSKEEAERVLDMMANGGEEITTQDEFMATIQPLVDADNAARKQGRLHEVEYSCKFCKTRYIMLVKPQDYDKWLEGNMKLNEFTYLDADEKEFLLSQICPVCWDKQFPEEE